MLAMLNSENVKAPLPMTFNSLFIYIYGDQIGAREADVPFT